MKLLFTKSKWEAASLSLESFLDLVKADGFDGTELYIPNQPETPRDIRRAHSRRGLLLVAQIVTCGATPDDHCRSFEERMRRAFDCQPLFINCHAGSDLFLDHENNKICQFGIDLARSLGVSLCFETHRGRPTFSGPSTCRLLQALPGMRLTADFSHWMCVHESLLSDQPKNIAAAQARSDHIHARIGFSQGPQVSHPLAREFTLLRDLYLGWWQDIAALRRSENRPYLTITPEAGPPPYMPIVPSTGQPIADAWQINVAVRDWLRHSLC